MLGQLKYTWPIWLGVICCLYIVFACEFETLRFIKLPYDENVVAKLNDIVKNMSLSYIAGMVFYLLSEMIPYLRKRRFVLKKLNAEIQHVRQIFIDFYLYFCGQNVASSIPTIDELFYSTTGREYEREGAYSMPADKMLALRKLLSAIDNAIELLLANDIYIGEDNFKIVLNIKTKECLTTLRGIVQAQSDSLIDNEQLYDLLENITIIEQEINKLTLKR